MNLQIRAAFCIAILYSIACAVAPAAEPLRVRVLSYNIHHGEGTDRKFDLERIAKVIRATEPDLVALQEVDRKTKRASGVDQPAELGRLTGLTPIFERNIDFSGGEYGNAILSRWKVMKKVNHALPSFYRGEQRGVLEIEVQPTDEQTLRFLATHLDYRPNDGERRASVEAIEKWMAGNDSIPTILAGDLNATPESAVIAGFRQSWYIPVSTAPLLTFPSDMPVRQIDYVCGRPIQSWKLITMRVIDEPTASDHRPLLVVLEWVPPAR